MACSKLPQMEEEARRLSLRLSLRVFKCVLCKFRKCSFGSKEPLQASKALRAATSWNPMSCRGEPHRASS